jgi:hypothetical protein
MLNLILLCYFYNKITWKTPQFSTLRQKIVFWINLFKMLSILRQKSKLVFIFEQVWVCVAVILKIDENCAKKVVIFQKMLKTESVKSWFCYVLPVFAIKYTTKSQSFWKNVSISKLWDKKTSFWKKFVQNFKLLNTLRQKSKLLFKKVDWSTVAYNHFQRSKWGSV